MTQSQNRADPWEAKGISADIECLSKASDASPTGPFQMSKINNNEEQWSVTHVKLSGRDLRATRKKERGLEFSVQFRNIWEYCNDLPLFRYPVHANIVR